MWFFSRCGTFEWCRIGMIRPKLPTHCKRFCTKRLSTMLRWFINFMAYTLWISWTFSTLSTKETGNRILFYYVVLGPGLCGIFWWMFQFSHVDGTRLLTTDQHSQLRVYRSPHWTLEKIIPHPHRQFQHLTPGDNNLKARRAFNEKPRLTIQEKPSIFASNVFSFFSLTYMAATNHHVLVAIDWHRLTSEIYKLK